MNIIKLPEAPGIDGIRGVIGQIKALQDPDPWAGETPIFIECSSAARSLAKLLRLGEIPGVTLVDEVIPISDLAEDLYNHDPFNPRPSFWSPWSGLFDCLCRW